MTTCFVLSDRHPAITQNLKVHAVYFMYVVPSMYVVWETIILTIVLKYMQNLANCITKIRKIKN